jgi:hypothetical protein
MKFCPIENSSSINVVFVKFEASVVNVGDRGVWRQGVVKIWNARNVWTIVTASLVSSVILDITSILSVLKAYKVPYRLIRDSSDS